MTEDIELKDKKPLFTWLFNPFHFIAGGQALAVGLGIIVTAGLVGSISNSHFDGVLDFHTGLSVPVWVFVVEGLVDWLALSAPLLILGLLLSKSRIRVVDVLGTQALARFPSLLTAEAGLLALHPGFGRQVERLMSQNTEIVWGDLAVFGGALLVCIVMTIWMIVLMYRAFTVSCNVTGAKAVVAFIAALLVGEAISKIVLLTLYRAGFVNGWPQFTGMGLLCAVVDISCAALLMAVSLPVIYRKIPMNAFYGIRIPKAFQSEALWYDINEYGGRQFFLWSISLIAAGIGSLFVPFGDLGDDAGVIVVLLLTAVPASLFPIIAIIQTLRYAARLK